MREETIQEEMKENNFIKNFIQIHLQEHETSKRSEEKYKVQHDQHIIEKTIKVRDKVQLHLTKERLHGPSKTMRYRQYCLTIGEASDNAFKLNLLLYMCIYSLVKVKNLKLQDPFMLDYEIQGKVLPTIEELTLQSRAIIG